MHGLDYKIGVFKFTNSSQTKKLEDHGLYITGYTSRVTHPGYTSPVTHHGLHIIGLACFPLQPFRIVSYRDDFFCLKVISFVLVLMKQLNTVRVATIRSKWKAALKHHRLQITGYR